MRPSPESPLCGRNNGPTIVLPARHQSCAISFEKNAEPSQRTCNQVPSSIATSADDNHLTACLTASSWLSEKNFIVSNGTSSLPSMRQSPAMYSGMGIPMFSASRLGVANCASLSDDALEHHGEGLTPVDRRIGRPFEDRANLIPDRFPL